MAISARELTLILRVQSAGSQNIRRLQADLNGLERGAGSMGQRFAMASQAIGAVGRQMQLAGGIGTFALGLAANQAAQLSSKVTLAATQVTHGVAQTRRQATKDFQGILDQMSKFPSSADDMATALYDIYSTLNVTGKQGIPILQQINKAAVAGGLTSQEAGQGLLSVISNFDKGRATVDNARKSFNTMFAAVRYGRATMADLSTALATTAPAAKIAGQSLGNMAGTFAFLSRSLGPQKAAVSYARLVEVLSGTQMQTGLKSVGVNIDNANGKMKSMDQVIQILLKRFPYLSQGGIKALNFFKDIGNIQSTIQARRAFATLVTNFAGYRNILGKTINDNNEFRKSYAAMAASPGVQWNVLINNLKAVALQVGMAVLPAFVSISKYLREAIQWFNRLSPSTKDLIGKFAAFGAVGALIGGTLLTIVAAAGGAVVAMTGLGDALAVFGAGVFTYAGLAGVAKKIYDNWDQLGGLMKKVGMDIKRILEDLASAAKAFYQGDWSTLWSSLGDAIKTAIPSVIDALNLLKASIFAWFKDFFSSAQGIVTAGIAGMFAMNRYRGGGAGGGLAEKGLGALSTADLLSLAIGTPVGPFAMATKAATKADDAEKVIARLKALQTMGPGGVKGMLATNAFTGALSTRQAVALEEYVRRAEQEQKYAASIRGQMAMRWRTLSQSRGIAAAGIGDIQRSRFTYNPAVALANMMGANMPMQSTRQIGKFESMLLRSKMVMKDVGNVAGVGLSTAFSKLGTSIMGAGKNLLSFIGFGNPYIGGAIAAAGATYLLWRAINSGTDPAKRAQQGLKDMTTGFTQARDGMRNATDGIIQLNAAKLTLRQQTAQVNHLKNVVSNAKVGTDAYKNAETALNQAQQNRVQTVNDLATAQQNLNASLLQATGGIDKGSKGLSAYLQNIPDVRTLARNTSIQNNPLASRLTGSGTPAIVKNAQNQMDQMNSKLKTNIGLINQAASAFNTFMAAGGNVKAGQGAQVLNDIANAMSKAYVGSTKLAGPIKTITQVLGRLPGQDELRAFADLPKNILPGVTQFMRIMHQLPGSMTTSFLEAHKRIQQSAGAIIATLGHLPSKKQIQFLTNHRQYDQQIANFIRRFHQLPDKKHMQIIIDTQQAENKLNRARQHVARMQTAVHQIGRLRPDINVNTSKLDRNIAKGKAQIDALDKKVTTPHSKNYNIVFHPQISQAISQASTLGANLDQGVAQGITANAYLVNIAMQGVVSGAVAAGATKAQTGSPSKLAKKKIGDPILQGILQPLKDKKSVQDAANTAVSNMIDAFNTAKDTYRQQLGDLFAGPTFMGPNQEPTALQQKLQWGEPVNIQDLRGDLNAQLGEFSKFQKSLNRLDRRRHTPFAFIDQIRQLGPAAQSEVNALLKATPRQLRAYEKLWEKSQKSVNNTARHTVQSQVAAWKKQGAAIALGFMSGMADHKAQMARFFHNLFLSLFNQVKHVHKSHSPSKLYMEEGMNVMEGFRLGVMKGQHPIRMPRLYAPVGRWEHARPLVTNVTNNYYNRTYNVYTQQSENLLSALRKHDHITRLRP